MLRVNRSPRPLSSWTPSMPFGVAANDMACVVAATSLIAALA